MSFFSRYSSIGLESDRKEVITEFFNSILTECDWAYGTTKIFLKDSAV